jgi:hypothetical protein
MFGGHTATVSALAVSADARYLATGSAVGTVRVWNLVWELDDQDARAGGPPGVSGTEAASVEPKRGWLSRVFGKSR